MSKEIIDLIKGMKRKTKKKHCGKTWCPDCEDVGFNDALDEISEKIK